MVPCDYFGNFIFSALMISEITTQVLVILLISQLDPYFLLHQIIQTKPFPFVINLIQAHTTPLTSPLPNLSPHPTKKITPPFLLTLGQHPSLTTSSLPLATATTHPTLNPPPPPHSPHILSPPHHLYLQIHLMLLIILQATPTAMWNFLAPKQHLNG